MNTNDHLDKLYQQRFPDAEQRQKDAIWKVLCSDFFQRFVRPEDTVVDLGAGYCEFINNIRAARKIAVDLNPDVRHFAAAGVEVINALSTSIDGIATDSVDVVFMSNFLEHMPDKEAVLATLRESWRILKPGGRVIVLQPNIRFLAAEYWDFFDHHTPLSDRSLVEGLRIAGFVPKIVHPRFLPYTTKSRLPKAAFLVRLYLRVPLAWQFLGKQALVVADKEAAAGDPAAQPLGPPVEPAPPPAASAGPPPGVVRRLLAARPPLAILVPLAALAFLLILALGAPPIPRGLDPSWTEVLGWGFLHHAQWGRDLVFTYGPLGFLQPYASYVDGIFNWYVAGAIALPLTFALTICLLLRRGSVATALLFVAAYVVWCSFLAGDIAWALTLVFGTAYLIRTADERRGLAWTVVAVLLAPVFGAIALTKFSMFPLWAICVAMLASLQLAAGRRLTAALLAVGFVGAFVVVWIATGQHLKNLPAFIAAGLEISSGYPHAMGTRAPQLIEVAGLGLLAIFMLACAYAIWANRRDWSAWATASLCALSALLFWMACIIRGDHWPWFFPAISLLPFVLLSDRRLVAPRFLRPVLIAVVVLAVVVEPPARSLATDATFRVRNAAYNLAHLPELAAARSEQWRAAAKEAALPKVRGRVRDSRVDMLTWEQGMVLLNGFNYAPRPVFQSYSAFTPKLARLNESYFLGADAPSYVLLRLDYIDERLPMSEDGLALIALLQRYRPVLREKGFLLLERHGRLSARPVVPDGPTTAGTLGEDVAIAEPNTPTIAFADIRLTLFGKLYTMLFREPPLRITLNTGSNATQRYRLVRPTAASGFVITPLITGNDDIIKLYYHKPQSNVRSFSIDTDNWLERYIFEGRYSVSFQPLGKLAPAPVGVETALLIYPGFNVVPSGETDYRTIIEDGQESVFIHAPGTIPFQPAPGRYRVSATYGLQRIAISDSGCRQLGPDGIGVSFVMLRDGREAVLAHESIDPFRTPGDIGPHTLSIDGIEIAAGDTFEYRVDGGPAGNVSCDWSYVRDLTFTPSTAEPISAKPQPYPGFNIEPLTTGLRVIEVDGGVPAVFLHAPASIVFEPPAGRYRISASYGLQNIAVKDPGCAKAGADGIGVSLVLQHGGRPSMLRHVELDPFSRTQDAGPHEFNADNVDVAAGDRLEWRVDSGPLGSNTACDWSYVRDFTFTRMALETSPPGKPARP